MGSFFEENALMIHKGRAEKKPPVIAGLSACIAPARPDDDERIDPPNTSPSTEIDRIKPEQGTTLSVT